MLFSDNEGTVTILQRGRNKCPDITIMHCVPQGPPSHVPLSKRRHFHSAAASTISRVYTGIGVRNQLFMVEP
jgi:hypothetical protein